MEKVTFVIFVLGRRWRCYQGGIDHGVGFERQAARNQDVVDGDQNLFCEFVFFQSVPKTQNKTGFSRSEGVGVSKCQTQGGKQRLLGGGHLDQVD